ncbi:response regulator [Eisenibacter elegans]|jgi:CheY-like chemotaxis protein|uniref:response regulator n=1 Tax=Eisenibacter elegans TaxID=997 RepID=UPI00041B56F6|nr:response regulator [Eisenibacter elegans]
MSQQSSIKCIILVDDDEVSNLINERSLHKYNPQWEVKVFTQAPEALHFLSTDALEDTLILLDLNMPELDGWALMAQLAMQKSDFKVLILTSSIRKQDIVQAKNYAQILGYVVKPLDVAKIEKFLKDL